VIELSATRDFMCIGGEANTEWAAGTGLIRDEDGLFLTGNDLSDEMLAGSWPRDRRPFDLETSVPGFFAIGDVRRGSIKRVASAVGEGACAVSYVHRFLAEA
jgi:thioredoxin reductase (NADPH)